MHFGCKYLVDSLFKFFDELMHEIKKNKVFFLLFSVGFDAGNNYKDEVIPDIDLSGATLHECRSESRLDQTRKRGFVRVSF